MKKKSQLIKVIISILILACISVGIFFLCRALGITDIENLQETISKCGAWGIVVYILIRVVCTVFMCFVPSLSMIFDLTSVALFGANWKALLICLTSVYVASFVMDLIGRYGGRKFIIKLVGEKSYNNALKLIQTKGMVYVPVMYLLPIFPDDAICMVSGALKSKWWVHYIEIVLCRGIGCVTTVLGMNLLPVELISNLKTFNWSFIGGHLFDYLEMITVLAFWLLVLLLSARKIDVWLSKRLKEKRKSR